MTFFALLLLLRLVLLLNLGFIGSQSVPVLISCCLIVMLIVFCSLGAPTGFDFNLESYSKDQRTF